MITQLINLIEATCILCEKIK